MITDRDDLYELAIDVHDCAGSVRRGIGLPQFPGWNFRASELQGAVARVQLGRLDGLLERMRANQAWLAERVAELPGLTLRRPNDDGGDAGICLIAFARDAGAGRRRGRRAARGRRHGDARSTPRPSIDLHVYPFWKPVLDAIADGRPAGARLPAHARPARARDPRRRLAALRRAGPRRDRARVQEGRARRARVTVRVGVVGGGLVAQAMHLPYLSALRDRFQLAGARRAERRPSARRSARATASRACTPTTARCSTPATSTRSSSAHPPEPTPRSCSPHSTPACTSSSRSRCASRSPTPTRSSPRATEPGASSRSGR